MEDNSRDGEEVLESQVFRCPVRVVRRSSKPEVPWRVDYGGTQVDAYMRDPDYWHGATLPGGRKYNPGDRMDVDITIREVRLRDGNTTKTRSMDHVVGPLPVRGEATVKLEDD